MTGVMRVGPGHGQPLDDGRGEDRGVVLAGHRAVAPRAADGDAVRGEALLGDLDRVEPAPGDGRRHAAAFVDGAGRAQPLRPVLGDPFRAGQAARLLVCGAREQDVASETRDRVAGGVEPGGPRLGGEQPDDPELHRDHRLHVDRAATVDVAVLRCRRRTDACVQRSGGAGTTSRCDSRRNGSPPVPSPRRRTWTEPRPGSGSTTSGSSPISASMAAIRRATRSSPSGASGGRRD